jgi:hypothetical protein
MPTIRNRRQERRPPRVAHQSLFQQKYRQTHLSKLPTGPSLRHTPPQRITPHRLGGHHTARRDFEQQFTLLDRLRRMYGALAIRLAADLQRSQVATVLLDPSRQGPVQWLHVSDDLRLFIVVERKRTTRVRGGAAIEPRPRAFPSVGVKVEYR